MDLMGKGRLGSPRRRAPPQRPDPRGPDAAPPGRRVRKDPQAVAPRNPGLLGLPGRLSAARPVGTPSGPEDGTSSGGRHGTPRVAEGHPTATILTGRGRIRPEPPYRSGPRRAQAQSWPRPRRRRRGGGGLARVPGGHRCPGGGPRGRRTGTRAVSCDGAWGARPACRSTGVAQPRLAGTGGRTGSNRQSPRDFPREVLRRLPPACAGLRVGLEREPVRSNQRGLAQRPGPLQATETVPTMPRSTWPGTLHHMSNSPASAVHTNDVVAPPAMVVEKANCSAPRSPM